MNISLGFSPCPNDTYMFAAIANGWIDTGSLSFSIRMEDVETLNEWATESKLDVTKLSFHRALYLENEYRLLSAGAALGFGCGPLVIAKENISLEELCRGIVALPGEWTTAHLLFKLYFPDAAHKQFSLFSDIENLILNGKVNAGVIIHENRFTYASKGLKKILDLGETWEKNTGLPIPLGGIFASNHILPNQQVFIEKLIHDSIIFAHAHPEKVMPYVREFSQEMDDEVMKNHIRLYVNEFSLDLGETGRAAISRLKKVLK